MNDSYITQYLPIFREKLFRLEETGRGGTAEARKLRDAIRRVELATGEPNPALQDAA